MGAKLKDIRFKNIFANGSVLEWIGLLFLMIGLILKYNESLIIGACFVGLSFSFKAITNLFDEITRLRNL